MVNVEAARALESTAALPLHRARPARSLPSSGVCPWTSSRKRSMIGLTPRPSAGVPAQPRLKITAPPHGQRHRERLAGKRSTSIEL